MNNNETNPDMNLEEYEDIAVKKSNTAKRVGIGAAIFAGGAALTGGAAYAALHHGYTEGITDEPLTMDDVIEGGNVGEEPIEEEQPEIEVHHTETTTERVVYVERVPETPHDEVTWDEKTVIYDSEDNVVASVESGTVQGHQFALYDLNGDNHADYLAIDQNNNGQFDAGEFEKLDWDDHVHMGHDTAKSTEIHNHNNYIDIGESDDEIIHNDFYDEKTGENYRGDFAQNNPDYNPKANIDMSSNADVTFEENYPEMVTEGDVDTYMAESNGDTEAYGDIEPYDMVESNGDTEAYGDIEPYDMVESNGDTGADGDVETYDMAESNGDTEAYSDVETYDMAESNGDTEAYGDVEIAEETSTDYGEETDSSSYYSEADSQDSYSEEMGGEELLG